VALQFLDKQPKLATMVLTQCSLPLPPQVVAVVVLVKTVAQMVQVVVAVAVAVVVPTQALAVPELQIKVLQVVQALAVRSNMAVAEEAVLAQSAQTMFLLQLVAVVVMAVLV
jgi:hypothetical protein